MAPTVPLPPVSSIDCAVALHRAGFAITTLTPERIVLQRRGRSVVVHRHKTIDPPELLLILRAARVSPQEFLELLLPVPGHASGVRGRASLEELVAEAARAEAASGGDDDDS